MITIPAERIRASIREHTGLSEAQIDARVAEKLASLSGLISKEGALHILANELGVKVAPDKDKTKVKDLLAGMRINIPLRVVRVYEVRNFSKDGREGKVASFLAGDETGVTRVTLWNEHAEKLTMLSEGSTVLVREGTVRENQGRLEIHAGAGSELVIEPPGVTVSVNATDVSGVGERPYARKKISELTNQDEYVDILGTIVQVYDPRSFTKKTGQKTGEQGLVCAVLIDDSTEKIRASFWDNDCRALLGDAVDRPENLESAKLELLGTIIKVQGRCKMNAAYNQLELSVTAFTLNPDPAAELSRIS
jgi:replication factor A1